MILQNMWVLFKFQGVTSKSCPLLAKYEARFTPLCYIPSIKRKQANRSQLHFFCGTCAKKIHLPAVTKGLFQENKQRLTRLQVAKKALHLKALELDAFHSQGLPTFDSVGFLGLGEWEGLARDAKYMDDEDILVYTPEI